MSETSETMQKLIESINSIDCDCQYNEDLDSRELLEEWDDGTCYPSVVRLKGSFYNLI